MAEELNIEDIANTAKNLVQMLATGALKGVNNISPEQQERITERITSSANVTFNAVDRDDIPKDISSQEILALLGDEKSLRETLDKLPEDSRVAFAQTIMVAKGEVAGACAMHELEQLNDGLDAAQEGVDKAILVSKAYNLTPDFLSTKIASHALSNIESETGLSLPELNENGVANINEITGAVLSALPDSVTLPEAEELCDAVHSPNSPKMGVVKDMKNESLDRAIKDLGKSIQLAPSDAAPLSNEAIRDGAESPVMQNTPNIEGR